MGNKLTDEEVVNALGNMRSTDTVGFFYDKENKQYVYATAKEVFDLIHRQKAEIERLTEIRNSFRQEVITLNNEKLELQKQVDDLKKTISIKEGYIDRVESEVVEWQIATKKAVKDTAKEILKWLKAEVIMTEIPHGSEPCEEDVEAVMWWQIEEHFKKEYGVEVE